MKRYNEKIIYNSYTDSSNDSASDSISSISDSISSISSISSSNGSSNDSSNSNITTDIDSASGGANLELSLNLIEDYIPVIAKIVSKQVQDITPIFRDTIPYPKSIYGFHHYIHQSKQKMSLTNIFKDKKKVYEVCSKFEKNIDDYENDLGKASQLYFNIGPKPNLLSRAFFKLWEILFMFDLVNKDKLVTAHLAEGPGSFIQATMFFRDMFYEKKSKTDKYHAITLHSDTLDVHKEFIKYYEKEKPQRFILYPTDKKDNGDLTNLKIIENFSKEFTKDKADFITADGGFEWVNETLQEQEAFPLILGQVVTALNIQAKGGNFVCKIYESYTDLMIKLIAYITPLYEHTFIIKPYTSRKSNSEKYIICKNFLDKDTKKVIATLSELLKQVVAKKHINDIFPESVSQEFKNTMIVLNTDVSNRQFQNINEIIDFINKENYRGDDYQDKRQQQIDATTFWLQNFFVDPANFESQKAKLQTFVNSIIDHNKTRVTNLGKKID